MKIIFYEFQNFQKSSDFSSRKYISKNWNSMNSSLKSIRLSSRPFLIPRKTFMQKQWGDFCSKKYSRYHYVDHLIFESWTKDWFSKENPVHFVSNMIQCIVINGSFISWGNSSLIDLILHRLKWKCLISRWSKKLSNSWVKNFSFQSLIFNLHHFHSNHLDICKVLPELKLDQKFFTSPS